MPEEQVRSSRRWLKTFSALSNANYRYFYVGQGISLIGTWTRIAALGWISFQFTHSEFLLGIVFMLYSLPIFLFAVYAGSMADRIPKIRIFTLTSWLALLTSLTVAIMLFYGPVPIGYLMIFASVWGFLVAFEIPARQTLMVELVGKKDLVNAIALNSSLVNSARVIGPAIGGLVLAVFGAAWCFFLDAMSYLAVLYAIHKIELPESHYEPRKINAGLRYTLEGFKYVRTNSTMIQTVVLLFIMGLGGWAYQSQLSAFAVAQLKLGARGYGWFLTSNGLGACSAALVVANRGIGIVRIRTLLAGACVYGSFIILLGFIDHPLEAAFVIFFVGFGIILFFSVANSLIQTQSPDHIRGRLMGIWAMIFGGSMPLGSFWMGVIAQKFGPGKALQAGGFFCIIGAAVVSLLGWKSRSPQGGALQGAVNGDRGPGRLNGRLG